MNNLEIAQILEEIADILDIQGIPFKPIAYRRSAETVKSYPEPIKDLNYKQLLDLPGIGKNIAQKIEEINKTGNLAYFEDLKKQCPIDFESLLAVEGVGPKTVKLLYKSLDIKNLDELEYMAKRHRIRRIKGMSDKKEAKILENIKYAKKTTRNLLGHMLPRACEIKNDLQSLDQVIAVEVAGSIRRRKETIGDIDILVITDRPLEIMEYFTAMGQVDRIMAKGPTKSTVKLKDNISCDLRLVPEKSFGSALLYFTGSKEVNVELRKIAIKKGWKLSEYGLFAGDELIASETEAEIFQKLGMHYLEPEIRETVEDVEAAIKGKLPDLIGYHDIKGDLQIHTTWSDGSNTLKDMVETGQKFDYQYLAITDHAGTQPVVGVMDERRIKQQFREIEKLNDEIQDLTILKGLEVNIDSQGKLDIKNRILNDVDIVVATINTGFRQSKEQITSRIISAMENEKVNIIAHPTGRKIHQREAYELDMDRIFQTSQDTNTYLEVNSQPERLDLKDVHIKKAVEADCKLAINSDARSNKHLKDIHFGIATARRGWAEKKDIINTRSLKKLYRLLKK